MRQRLMTAAFRGSRKTYAHVSYSHTQATKSLTKEDLRLVKARATLQKAVQVLSMGLPISMPYHDQINTIIQKDVNILVVNELELLALAYYEGNINDAIGEDPAKAVELWNKAIDMGSIESKFRLATSIRRGYGIEKDSQKALQLFLELAEQHNHPKACVRILAS